MPADDPRLALRGQRMLVADRPIAAHECVGVYGGALSTEPEFALKYGDRFATRAARRGRGATRRRSDARVARAFRNERPRVDRAPRDERGAPSTPTRVAPSPRPGAEHERYVFRVYFDDVTLVIDPWPAAGDARLMAMNDCRLAPAPALPKAARDRQNVHFKCLFLEGFPFVVAVATRCVEIKSSTRLQCECMRPFRREIFCRASRTRREQSIRPKISRIDVDLAEIESSEVWLG